MSDGIPKLVVVYDDRAYIDEQPVTIEEAQELIFSPNYTFPPPFRSRDGKAVLIWLYPERAPIEPEKPTPKPKAERHEPPDSAYSPPVYGDRLLVGWKEIAHAARWSERKAKDHRDNLIEAGYLRYELRGKPPRRMVVIWLSDLKAYFLRTTSPSK